MEYSSPSAALALLLTPKRSEVVSNEEVSETRLVLKRCQPLDALDQVGVSINCDIQQPASASFEAIFFALVEEVCLRRSQLHTKSCRVSAPTTVNQSTQKRLGIGETRMEREREDSR